jgi:hypothetical protein
MLEQWLKRKTIGAARRTLRPLNWIRQGWRGHRYQKRWDAIEQGARGIAGNAGDASNPLRNYVRSKEVGPGIWKWDHYLDIYNRHFEKFRGKEINVLEIGVYSGGSIEMWREYFGPKCRVYGVDWDPSCRIYESESVKIFIGDQADRQFWRQFKEQVPLSSSTMVVTKVGSRSQH